jgi:PEP-CTERM motif
MKTQTIRTTANTLASILTPILSSVPRRARAANQVSHNPTGDVPISPITATHDHKEVNMNGRNRNPKSLTATRIAIGPRPHVINERQMTLAGVLSLVIVLLTLPLCARADVVPCPMPHGEAYACADLLLFDAKFQLTAGEAVHAGGTQPSKNYVGSGKIGPKKVQHNWLAYRKFGPFEGVIHMYNGPVQAWVPPPNLSLYESKITGFFDFYNYSTEPDDIMVHWNARYSEIDQGNHSDTYIKVEEITKNVRTGRQLTDKLVMDKSLANDHQENLVDDSGDFLISIDPATFNAKGRLIPGWTSLTLSADVGAQAYVPEPSSLLLLGSGILGLAGVLRKRLIT